MEPIKFEKDGKTVHLTIQLVRVGGYHPSWLGRLLGFAPRRGRCAGFDYKADGETVAASRWDGEKLVRIVAPGWEGLFGHETSTQQGEPT